MKVIYIDFKRKRFIKVETWQDKRNTLNHVYTEEDCPF